MNVELWTCISQRIPLLHQFMLTSILNPRKNSVKWKYIGFYDGRRPLRFVQSKLKSFIFHLTNHPYSFPSTLFFFLLGNNYTYLISFQYLFTCHHSLSVHLFQPHLPSTTISHFNLFLAIAPILATMVFFLPSLFPAIHVAPSNCFPLCAFYFNPYLCLCSTILKKPSACSTFLWYSLNLSSYHSLDQALLQLLIC